MRSELDFCDTQVQRTEEEEEELRIIVVGYLEVQTFNVLQSRR